MSLRLLKFLAKREELLIVHVHSFLCIIIDKYTTMWYLKSKDFSSWEFVSPMNILLNREILLENMDGIQVDEEENERKFKGTEDR